MFYEKIFNEIVDSLVHSDEMCNADIFDNLFKIKVLMKELNKFINENLNKLHVLRFDFDKIAIYKKVENDIIDNICYEGTIEYRDGSGGITFNLNIKNKD